MDLTHILRSRGTGSTTLVRVAVVVVSAAVAGIAAGAGSAPMPTETPAAAYARGMALFKEKKHDEAAETLCAAAKSAVGEQPAVRAKYHVACATALLKSVRWAEADAYFSEAQRADPDNPLIYSGMAAYAERKNDWKGAVELYARSIQLQKDPKWRSVFQARMEAAKVKLAAAERVSAEVSNGAGADVSDSDGDCEKICAKLLRCKAGPWESAEDCSAACEGAQEDRIASRTYRCVARAKSCSAIARCTHR